MQFLIIIFIIQLVRLLVQSLDNSYEERQRAADIARSIKSQLSSLQDLVPKGMAGYQIRKNLANIEQKCFVLLQEKLGKAEFITFCADQPEQVLLLIQLFFAQQNEEENLLTPKAAYYYKLLENEQLAELRQLTWQEIVRNVPVFMWLRIGNYDADFFLHIARGRNVREYPGCADYSRKMAHAFHTAEPNYWVWDNAWAYCLIRAQVIEVNFPARFWTMVLSYAETPAQRIEGRELERIIRWWVTVVTPSKYTDMQRAIIYNYLAELISEGNFFPVGKKSVDTVFRLAQERYLRLQKERELLVRRRAENSSELDKWESSGLQEWNLREDTTWYICQELLTSVDLELEGCRMSHCVGEYIESCMLGECSIWSIRKKEFGAYDWTSLVTISVTGDRKYIDEYQGYGNECLSTEEQVLMNQWSSLNGL